MRDQKLTTVRPSKELTQKLSASDREYYLEQLRRLRPIDDTFMRCIFRDNVPLAQFVLRTILGRDDIVLVSAVTQWDIRRLEGGRSLCLDLHCVDTLGRCYDLEVQRDKREGSPKRLRYHASALDVENLQESQDFEQLPEMYIVFLMETDVGGFGEAVYPVERMFVKQRTMFRDQAHLLYVNGSYRGDDAIGRLMHDFFCSDPEEMYYPLMAEATRRWKTHETEVTTVCRVMEEIEERGAERERQKNAFFTIQLLRESGFDNNVILQKMSRGYGLSDKQLRELIQVS